MLKTNQLNKYKMKNCKTILVQAMIFLAVILGSSCGNKTDKKDIDTKEAAQDSNEVKMETANTKSTEKDAKFLVNVAEINIEEISLGQLAQQKGTMQHVKDLGKMMEDGHAKVQNDLVALAKVKSISIPTSQTESGQDAYKKLIQKSGLDFDKSYAEMMVSGHKDAIAIFETASTDSSDPDIKKWATGMLPSLKDHLKHAQMCQSECDKK